MNGQSERRGGWSWWYLLFVISARRDHLAALLQQDRAVLDRHSVFLLVPDVLRDRRRGAHCDRLLRHRRLKRARVAHR